MTLVGSSVNERLFTPDFVRLLVTNMAFQFGFASFFLLPKYMAQELHSGPAEIGWVTTAFGLAVLVAVPLVGRLLDELGTRRVLLAGSVLAVIAALGYLAVDRVGPLLLSLRCVQGLALSMFINAGSLVAANHAPTGRLAQAMGVFAASGMVMTAAAPAVAELLAERWGYAPAFLAASASALLALLLARGLPAAHDRGAQRGSLVSMLRRATSQRMIVVLAATGLGFGAMFTFSLPYALELGLVSVRGFFLAFTASSLLVRLGFGGLIDRTGHRRSATYAVFGYAATVGAMYLLTPDRLSLFGALFGLAHGLFIPAFTAFVVNEVASYERGKLLTLFNGAFNLGNSLAFGLGMAAERFGYRNVFAITGVIVLAAPIALLGWPERASSADSEPAEGGLQRQ